MCDLDKSGSKSTQSILYIILIILYNSHMTSLTISELRADIASAVKSAKKTPVSISRHGEEVAVLISSSMYEAMLEKLEDLEDIAAYDAAKARKEESVLWSEARKDLGLR